MSNSERMTDARLLEIKSNLDDGEADSKETADLLAEVLHQREEIVKLREALRWALDLIAMYDKELIRRGDDPAVVNSDTHLAGLNKARTTLEETK